MRPVMSVGKLRELLAAGGADGPAPVLLDVRWSLAGGADHAAYQAGHLPGAVFLDLDRDLADPPGERGRHPLPDPHRLAVALGRAGVTPDAPVVVYDAADGSVAARLWWLLRWVGHRDVAVLDGGYAQWVREGLDVTTEPSAGPVSQPYPQTPGAMPVLDADEAAAMARRGLLLDARAPGRYRGETEPVDPRPGHIPGAHNAPFSELTDETGRWLSGAELDRVLDSWGIGRPAEAAAYCGSGVTACTLVLAAELAGRSTPDQPIALYPGSWSAWSADPARPTATGPEPG